eukprot:4948121-Amphidinium_carterae.1
MVEDIDKLTGQQYFVEEAASDDINNEHYDHDVKDFNKLLQYIRQFLIDYFYQLEDYVTTGEEDQYEGHYKI